MPAPAGFQRGGQYQGHAVLQDPLVKTAARLGKKILPVDPFTDERQARLYAGYKIDDGPRKRLVISRGQHIVIADLLLPRPDHKRRLGEQDGPLRHLPGVAGDPGHGPVGKVRKQGAAVVVDRRRFQGEVAL